jgi:hypothetical protein
MTEVEEMDREKTLCKIPFARVYCKKARREGFLLAVIKSVGNNIHVDFLIEFDDGTTRFAGRKILKSIKVQEIM